VPGHLRSTHATRPAHTHRLPGARAIHCWILGLAFGSLFTLPWGENAVCKLAKPCRRGKFGKISFSPRLCGKLTSKEAQPKWRKTDSCVAHGPSPTPVGSSGLWCQGTFVARVLLGPHTPTAFLGPVPYIVGFSGLHLVQFSHCRGAKIRCISLPNLVGGVNLAKFRSVRNCVASLQARKLSQNGAKLTPVWLTAPPRLLSVHRGYGARAPS
jgi:hypothetical protein